MEPSSDFRWPDDPPQDWWEVAGAQLKMRAEHVRFTAALMLLGGPEAKKNGVAARLAGLEGGRTVAYRAARSVAVRKLLTEAKKIQAGNVPRVTDLEIDRRIDDLIRSPDAGTAAKGIELRARRDAGQVQPTLEQTAEQMTRQLMELCRPEQAPLVWGEIVLRGYRWHAPFIRQLVPYLAAHHSAEWRVYRGLLIGEVDQMAADVARLETGPLLSLEQLLAAAGVGRPVTPGCAFDGGQRDTAEAAPTANGAEIMDVA